MSSSSSESLSSSESDSESDNRAGIGPKLSSRSSSSDRRELSTSVSREFSSSSGEFGGV